MVNQLLLYEEFLRDIVGCNLFIPDIPKIQIPNGLLLLYNPCHSSLSYLLRLYEGWDFPAQKGIPNIVDDEVYEESFLDVDHELAPYFFICTAPDENARLIPAAQIFDTVGIIKEMSKEKGVTMTIAEAIYYDLFSRYCGNPTGFPLHSIITRTMERKTNTPLVIGFDQDQICNRIRFYNGREMVNHNVSYKQILQHEAAHQ